MDHAVRLRRRVCLATTALALAAPGVAVAQVPPPPSVTVAAPCYTPGDPIVEVGKGFTPGAAVNETVSFTDPATSMPLGSLQTPPLTTQPDGSFTRALRAPDLRRNIDAREAAQAVFAEVADPTKSATVTWTLSVWFVDVAEWDGTRVATAKPGTKMTVSAMGWTGLGPSLYAHYVRGSTEVKAVKLGALTGPCRDLSRRRVRQFPFKAVKPGKWTVYFSTTKVFDKRLDAYGVYKVRVKG
jgi:hypothetical protein